MKIYEVLQYFMKCLIFHKAGVNHSYHMTFHYYHNKLLCKMFSFFVLEWDYFEPEVGTVLQKDVFIIRVKIRPVKALYF